MVFPVQSRVYYVPLCEACGIKAVAELTCFIVDENYRVEMFLIK